VLKSYNKKQTPEDVTNCIRVLHKYGIRVHGMFISEGYSDIYHKLGIDSLQLSILIPVIGSKLYTSVQSARKFITEKFPNDWKLYDSLRVKLRIFVSGRWATELSKGGRPKTETTWQDLRKFKSPPLLPLRLFSPFKPSP